MTLFRQSQVGENPELTTETVEQDAPYQSSEQKDPATDMRLRRAMP